MKYTTTESKKTVEGMLSELSALVLPLFEQGQVAIADDEYANSPRGNVTLVSPSGIRFADERLNPLASPEFNFDKTVTDRRSVALKECNFFIEGTLPVTVQNIKHIRIMNKYTDGLFGRKTYGRLMTELPVTAAVGGVERPVAKCTFMLIIPDAECVKLEGLLVKYSRSDCLFVKVSGPARLSGGRAVAIGGREWLEYEVEVFPESFAIDSVD